MSARRSICWQRSVTAPTVDDVPTPVPIGRIRLSIAAVLDAWGVRWRMRVQRKRDGLERYVITIAIALPDTRGREDKREAARKRG